jgi:hypothetical protein
MLSSSLHSAGERLQATWSAVAQAAHDTGVAIWTNQTALIDQQLEAFFKEYPKSETGAAWGAQVAKELLAVRANDKSPPPKLTDNEVLFNRTFPAVEKVYVHAPDPNLNRETPPNVTKIVPTRYGPTYGFVTPFVFQNIVKQTAPLPDPRTSFDYVFEFNLVKSLGQDVTKARTLEQLYTGVFWGYDGSTGVGVPPRVYQQTLDAIVDTLGPKSRKVNSGFKLLRLYAVTTTAMADACISAWQEKYKWDFWRPVNGVRFRPAVKGTVADPKWNPWGIPQSLRDVKGNASGVPKNLAPSLRTPNFPAYPSGHATMGTAFYVATEIELRLPRAFSFPFTSDELNGTTVDRGGDARPTVPRKLTIKSAIEGNQLSRVYIGVHWLLDSTAGGDKGQEIGEKVATFFPRRIPSWVRPKPSKPPTKGLVTKQPKPPHGKKPEPHKKKSKKY